MVAAAHIPDTKRCSTLLSSDDRHYNHKLSQVEYLISPFLILHALLVRHHCEKALIDDKIR
jgi:hypothetical protein